MTFTPTADELLANNVVYAEAFGGAGLGPAPTRRLAIVACMDARLDVVRALGIADGEAHIIRNAGGVVTDYVIRSLTLSQRLLGTREIILVHHTKCGLEQLGEEAFARQLEDEVGERPEWSLESFVDPHVDVRQSMERLRRTPFVPHTDHVRGFVYDVEDGRLLEVDPAD